MTMLRRVRGGTFEAMGDPQHFVKVLVLGDGGVGKSTLVKTYVASGAPLPPIVPTRGVDFVSGFADISGQRCKYQFWDIGA